MKIEKLIAFDYSKKYYMGVMYNTGKVTHPDMEYPATILLDNDEYLDGGIRFCEPCELFKYAELYDCVREVTIPPDNDVYLLGNDYPDYVTNVVTLGNLYFLSLHTIQHLQEKHNANIFINDNALLVRMALLKDLEAVKYLLDSGASLYTDDIVLARLAVYNSDMVLLNILTDRGLNLKAYNNTIMKAAIEFKNYNMMIVLINRGVSIKIIPIDIALVIIAKSIPRLLKDKLRWFYAKIRNKRIN